MKQKNDTYMRLLMKHAKKGICITEVGKLVGDVILTIFWIICTEMFFLFRDTLSVFLS